jgi:hypothetical protein
MTKKRTICRSSETGQFVTAAYEHRHPSTTEKEKVPVGKKKA